MKNRILHLIILASFVLVAACATPGAKSEAPKNIIILIGDGMGFNHVDVASLFFHGETGKLVFESNEWLKMAQATYPAAIKTKTEIVLAAGYDPQTAWSDTAYLKQDYTDSGAAATALSTGFKTYTGAIGIGMKADTLKHITQLAKEIGKAAGIVTSVQISHATPAGFAAHNEHRRNYEQIAQQMILKSQLDVLIGCGHPLYDNDGKAALMDYKYIGGEELWKQLNEKTSLTNFVIEGRNFKLADIDGDGKPDPWTFISDSTEFAGIAAGINIPGRLLGIPKVHSTLQQSRSGSENIEPWLQPRNPKIPSLEQKTLAALNVLNQNSNGFFLMVEGGAIDWAAHDNHPGRMIEEMEDFVNSVAAVINWVEKNSNWNETLVIVTSDHETGMLWGESDSTGVLNKVTGQGKGQLPVMNWYSTDHTNALVPLYARGKGSESFSSLAGESDPVKGPFIQNTDVSKALFLMWQPHE